MTVKLSPGFPTREQAPGSTKRACLNHWGEVQCRKTLSVNLVGLHTHGTHACSTMYPCSYKHGYTAHEYPDRCLVSYYSGPLYGPSTCSCSIKEVPIAANTDVIQKPRQSYCLPTGTARSNTAGFRNILASRTKEQMFQVL